MWLSAVKKRRRAILQDSAKELICKIESGHKFTLDEVEEYLDVDTVKCLRLVGRPDIASKLVEIQKELKRVEVADLSASIRVAQKYKYEKSRKNKEFCRECGVKLSSEERSNGHRRVFCFKCKPVRSVGRWSEDEVGLLKKYYSNLSKSELEVLLPGKDAKSVLAKANRMRLRKSYKARCRR